MSKSSVAPRGHRSRKSSFEAKSCDTGHESDDTIVRHTVKTGRRRYRKISLAERYICIICGDEATSYNFGAITCESCKAFFRRNSTKRCYAVGMCKDEITLANEAARLKRSASAKAMRKTSALPKSLQERTPTIAMIYKVNKRRLEDDEYNAALSACREYVSAITLKAAEDETKIYFADADSPIKTYTYTEFLLRRFIKVLKKTDEFSELRRETQVAVLKANIIHCNPVNSGFFFDVEELSWSIYSEDGRFFCNNVKKVNAAFEKQSTQPFARYLQKYIEFHTDMRRQFVDWRIVMAAISLANIFYIEDFEDEDGEKETGCRGAGLTDLSTELSCLKLPGFDGDGVVSSSQELSDEDRELCRSRRQHFMRFLHDYALINCSDYESAWSCIRQKTENIRAIGALLQLLLKAEVSKHSQICSNFLPLIVELVNQY